MDATSPLPAPRRIVTHVDASGKSVISTEVNAEVALGATPLGQNLRSAWKTEGLIADLQEKGDTVTYIPSGMIVKDSGSHLLIVDSPPGGSAPMHRTDSIDYGFVLIGQIELELDDGSFRTVVPGDVVVQRGTKHSWHNKTDKWARMGFVVLPGKSITVDGKVLAADFY